MCVYGFVVVIGVAVVFRFLFCVVILVFVGILFVLLVAGLFLTTVHIHLQCHREHHFHLSVLWF